MFRKHYKNAYDKIEPNRELIDKVFEKAEAKKKPKAYTFAARYGVIAAALALVVVSVKFYPVIVPSTNEEPSFTNVYVTESEQKKYTADIETTPTLTADDLGANAKAKGAELQRNDAVAVTEFSSRKAAFTLEEFKAVSTAEEQIVYAFLTDKFGEKDEQLGHTFSFGIAGKTDFESGNYYLGRWSWLVDDHFSLLCEFILSEDMNRMYEVVYQGDKIVPLYENPLF